MKIMKKLGIFTFLTKFELKKTISEFEFENVVSLFESVVIKTLISMPKMPKI